MVSSHLVVECNMGPHLGFVQVEDAQFEVHALTASWETHTLKALSVTPLSCLPFSKLQVFFKGLGWKGHLEGEHNHGY